jgi:hypothetical protein
MKPLEVHERVILVTSHQVEVRSYLGNNIYE